MKMRKGKKQICLSDIYSNYNKNGFGHLFFLGILAYPKLNEMRQVKGFIEAVNSEKAKGLIKAGIVNKARIDNRYLKIEKRKAERNIEHLFETRIPRRMTGVYIALNLLNKWEPSRGKTVERIIKNWSQTAEHSNIDRLAWRETLPVLHLAFALFPFFHDVYLNEKPEFLTLSILDDLKEKGIKEVERELKKEIANPLKDLFILSNEIKITHQIKDVIGLTAKGTWLPGICKIAEAWSFLLPQMIPSIKKQDLYLI